MILDMPWERRGYDELLRHYESSSMEEEASVIRLIISERFRADSPGTDQEQL